MDAIAAVQRRSPRFLISEHPGVRVTGPIAPANWLQTGAIYLCRTPRTIQDVDGLSKYPDRPDPRWAGIVCFRGTADPRQAYVPWLAEGGDHCLHYGAFAVYGDPEVLDEVRVILAAAGFPPPRHRR
jgi:hypothetical protein